MNDDLFKVKLTGLSEDMEDFMLEQDDHYSFHKTKFWSSFWKTCVSMWTSGVDLSFKQMEIIEKEYNKVKKDREREYKKTRA